MKLDGLAAFVTVANTGFISEAARHLRLSKSAVSERLTELERTLGANLVQRNSRQLALTEDGLAFLERAKRIVSEADQAANELAQRRGEIAGKLRIAGPRGFGDLHLGPALYSLMERYPDVSITADFDDRIGDAASGYDAVVRIAPGEMPTMPTQTLTLSRCALVAAPSYLARFGRPAARDLLHGDARCCDCRARHRVASNISQSRRAPLGSARGRGHRPRARRDADIGYRSCITTCRLRRN